MRPVVFPALLAAALSLAGCRTPDPQMTNGNARIEHEGLALHLYVPETTVFRGETMPVTVTAENLTRQAMTIQATTSALVYVRLWRDTGAGWQQIKQYPQVAAMVITPWTLPAGGRREFQLNLPVEPDWPTGERLRLSAELNGRREAMAQLEILVVAGQGR